MRGLRWMLALVVLQAALLGLYQMVESRRSASTGKPTVLSTGPPHSIDLPFPSLSVWDREGRKVVLSVPERPILLHFWATWCPPCRSELPTLLELSKNATIDVLLISLDEGWDAIDQMLDRSKQTSVFLGKAERIKKSFQIQVLPTTFLLRPEGRRVLRFDGPRDWSAPDFLRSWLPPETLGSKP